MQDESLIKFIFWKNTTLETTTMDRFAQAGRNLHVMLAGLWPSREETASPSSSSSSSSSGEEGAPDCRATEGQVSTPTRKEASNPSNSSPTAVTLNEETQTQVFSTPTQPSVTSHASPSITEREVWDNLLSKLQRDYSTFISGRNNETKCTNQEAFKGYYFSISFVDVLEFLATHMNPSPNCPSVEEMKSGLLTVLRDDDAQFRQWAFSPTGSTEERETVIRTLRIQVWFRMMVWQKKGDRGWRFVEKALFAPFQGRMEAEHHIRLGQNLTQILSYAKHHMSWDEFETWLGDTLTFGGGEQFPSDYGPHVEKFFRESRMIEDEEDRRTEEEDPSRSTSDPMDEETPTSSNNQDLPPPDDPSGGESAPDTSSHEPSSGASDVDSRNSSLARGRSRYDAEDSLPSAPPPAQCPRAVPRVGESGAQNKTRHRSHDDVRRGRQYASRKVLNKTTRDFGERDCIPDAVCALLDGEIRAKIVKSLQEIPRQEGVDLNIGDVDDVLHLHRLRLVSTSSYYMRKGGLAFNILQERCCKLVLCLKLTTHGRRHAHHCISFDGRSVYDRPKKILVNGTSDRRSTESCNDVFDRLYPGKYFKAWDICQVFRLEENSNDVPGTLVPRDPASLPTFQTSMADSISALNVPQDVKDSITNELKDLSSPDAEICLSPGILRVPLWRHNLRLRNVTGEYRKKGGIIKHVSQDLTSQLIVNLSLCKTKGDNKTSYYAIAWDGGTIHDGSNKIRRAVGNRDFRKGLHHLFPKEVFRVPVVVSVHRLEPYEQIMY